MNIDIVAVKARFVATPLSAFLTGVVSVSAMLTVESLQGSTNHSDAGVIWMVAAIFFFLIPVLLFVLGSQTWRFNTRFSDYFTRDHFTMMMGAWLRMLYFVAGAISVSLAIQPFLHH